MREVKMKIIDLSHHNGKVDFVKVKASGIDGVIIRTGFGIEGLLQWCKGGGSDGGSIPLLLCESCGGGGQGS